MTYTRRLRPISMTLDKVINHALLAKYEYTGESLVTSEELTNFMNSLLSYAELHEIHVLYTFLSKDHNLVQSSSELDDYADKYPNRIIYLNGEPPIFSLVTEDVSKFRSTTIKGTPKDLYDIIRDPSVLKSLNIDVHKLVHEVISNDN